MSKKADMLVEEMKKDKWEELYDKRGLELSQVIPEPSKTKKHLYIHEWTVDNCNKGDHVLDVGCGYGHVAYLLKDKGCTITGVDVSEACLDIARKNVNDVTFKKGYIEDLSMFDMESFDVVCSNQTLEHLKDPRVGLDNMFRVLKQDGKLIVTVPIAYNLNVKEHLQHWNFYDIIELFEPYGDDFKVYWINKFSKYNDNTGELMKKNIFGIIMYKRGERDGR